MNMNLKKFLGKNHIELENAYGFTHYLELKDQLMLGQDQDHKRVVDTFLCFIHGEKLTVVKTDNDVLKDIVDVTSVDLREQLLALGKNEGLFYDDDLEISYAFITKKCFAYIFSSMLMVSANEKDIQQLVKFLDNFSLKYIGPEIRPDLNVKKATHYLQMKIVLDGIVPKIWRRFIVDDSITFHKLHQVIQIVMGWGNYHAYEFQVGKKHIVGEGDAEFCVDSMWREVFPSETKLIDAKTTMVKDILKTESQKFKYLYDLGDMWSHSIVLEKIFPMDEREYPMVLEGARSCPPEDCGGVSGYKELLKIRKNPSHPKYRELIKGWLPITFDPEYFDSYKINYSLRFGQSKRQDIKYQKLGRNDPCYCGSGKKYKKCCLEKDRKEIGTQRKIILKV